MKKFFRIFFLVLICLSAVFSLLSCEELDRLKEKRVLILDEETVEFNGVEYKELPAPPSGCSINNSCIGGYYAVEKSVPLFFMEEEGETCFYDEGRDMIVIKEHEYAAPREYCPVDKYEEYCSAIANAELDGIKFEYLVYDEKNECTRAASYIVEDETAELIYKYLEKDAKRLYREETDRGLKVIEVRTCDRNDILEGFTGEIFLYKDEKGVYGLITRKQQEFTGTWPLCLIPFDKKDKGGLERVYEAFEKLDGDYSRSW